VRRTRFQCCTTGFQRAALDSSAAPLDFSAPHSIPVLHHWISVRRTRFQCRTTGFQCAALDFSAAPLDFSAPHSISVLHH
jgi:hypothetical protein